MRVFVSSLWVCAGARRAAERCVLYVCSVRRLRSIGELKVSMHGPMKFVNSVLSPEGQATQEELAAKRAALHANKGPPGSKPPTPPEELQPRRP